MHLGILIASQQFESVTGAARLESAAQQLGHTVSRLYESKLSFEETEGRLIIQHAGESLPKLDAIIVRPNFTEEPSHHQYIYDALTSAGYRLLNGGAGVLRIKNKLLQRHDLRKANIAMPYWAIVSTPDDAAAAAERISYPVVIKAPFGTRGKGIFYAESSETLRPIIDYLTVRDGNPIIVEEFIREADRSDIRVFVVGGRVIASMRIVAASGDIRSNAAGTGEPVKITAEEASLAIAATNTMGLDISGVDLLRSVRGPLVMEVNANPGFEKLEQVTGTDVAGAIVRCASERGL